MRAEMMVGLLILCMGCTSSKDDEGGGDYWADEYGGSSDTAEPAETDGDWVAELGLAGRYTSVLGTATGCTVGEGGDAKSEDFWVVDWATGLLTIDGTRDFLTYTFPLGGEAGYDCSGAMNDEFAFGMSGNVIFEDTLEERDGAFDVDVMARLTVSGVGTGEKQADGCWTLSGDFTVTVNENDDEIDGNNCNLEVRFVASQLEGDDCSSI